MRSYYLRLCDYNRSTGSRGGVGHGDLVPDTGWEYELEIGNNQNCSPDLLALCVLRDEIMEHLQRSGALGQLLYDTHKRLKQCIEDDLHQQRQLRRGEDAAEVTSSPRWVAKDSAGNYLQQNSVEFGPKRDPEQNVVRVTEGNC